MTLVPAALKTAVTKGAAKVVNTVAPIFGYITKPKYEDRMNRVKARAAVHKLAAKFEMEEMEANQVVVRAEREQRINERLRQLEERRQDNLDAIAAKAVEAATEEPSKQPVDEDWMYKFMESCQDVGDAEMQSLWARILAGEVVAPGKYSARTLNCVRTMSKKDADIFTRFCSCLWTYYFGFTSEASPFIFDPNIYRETSGVDLEFNNLMHMESLGLIRFHIAGLNTNISFISDRSNIGVTIDYFGERTILHKILATPSKVFAFEQGQITLTEIGKQLAPISGAKANEAVRQSVLQQFRDRGWTLNLEHLRESADTGDTP